MSEEVPDILPDRGTDNANKIPLEREIGISSESGL
jgi:hypothetical protein